MTANEILRELEPFLDGELSPEAWQSVHAHLDGCLDCLQVFDFHAELRMVIAEEVPTGRAAARAARSHRGVLRHRRPRGVGAPARPARPDRATRRPGYAARPCSPRSPGTGGSAWCSSPWAVLAIVAIVVGYLVQGRDAAVPPPRPAGAAAREPAEDVVAASRPGRLGAGRADRHRGWPPEPSRWPASCPTLAARHVGPGPAGRGPGRRRRPAWCRPARPTSRWSTGPRGCAANIASFQRLLRPAAGALGASGWAAAPAWPAR